MSSGPNRTQDDSSRAQLRAENRQTYMLFGVATIFIVGHFLRIALNVQELYWLVNGRGGTEDPEITEECESPSRSVNISSTIHHFLNLSSVQFEVLAPFDHLFGQICFLCSVCWIYH